MRNALAILRPKFTILVRADWSSILKDVNAITRTYDLYYGTVHWVYSV